jgi:hypothetical protein
MTMDPSYVQLNRAATERMRRLVARLSDAELHHEVGEHWTVSIALAHLTFWDRRVLLALDRTAQGGKLFTPEIDLVVNDVALPLWAAIPPRRAAQLAIDTADMLDKRLEALPEPLLDQLFQYNRRWVIRALHRNEHLDDVDAALAAAPRPGTIP